MTKEWVKHNLPILVYAARLPRLVLNQARFPYASTFVDLQGRILDGPFRGVRFPNSRVGRDNFPMVLGTFELCLAPLVERVVRRDPPLIIDVGASYGYYALGFAFRCSKSRVIAYEMDPTRASTLRKYVRLNRLANIDVRGRCTREALTADLQSEDGALVFMDVEGAEDELLEPKVVNGLGCAEIIVELHEMFRPGVTDRLRDRFWITHQISVIPETRATVQARVPGLIGMRSMLQRMAAENRGEQGRWMHLVPKRQSAK